MFSRESESLLNAIDDVAFVKSCNGKVIYTNHLYNYYRRQQCEKNPDTHLLNKMLLHSHQDEEVFSGKIVEYELSGVEFGVDSNIKYRKSPYFKNDHVVGVITVIKGLVGSLSKNDVELFQIKKAMNSGNIGIWNWDLESNIVSFSEQWLRHIGYEQHEFGNTYEAWRESLHPDDLEDVACKMSETIKLQKKNEEFCFRFRCKNGSYLWFNAYASSFVEQDGRKCVLGCYVDITEKKRVEYELKKSKDLYCNLINTLPYGVLLSDLQGRVVFCNKAYASMYGYDESDLVGSLVWNLINDPDEQMLYKNKYFDYMQNRVNPQRFTTTGRKRNGAHVDVQVTWNYIFESDGEVEGIISIITDISDQVKTENERKFNQKLYQNLIEGLPDVIMRFDRDYRHLFVSPNISEIMPVDPDNVIGKTHRDLGFPQEMCQMWEDSLASVFETGTPHETESEFESLKGKVTYNWRFIPEFDDYGLVKAILTIARNITSNKALEQDLRHIEERFVTAMNVSSDGLWDLNLNTMEVYFSKGWTQMLGFEENEIKHDLNVFYDMLHPEEIDGLKDRFNRFVSSNQERFEAEFRMKHKNGNWVNILSRANSVFDEDGKLYRIIGTHINYTERKKFENELIEAKRNAEAANLAKDEFLATMSHELRTPLNPIMGYASLMQCSLTDKPYSDYLNSILISGQRMVLMIDELLSFSRMQSERIDTKAELFNLKDFVEESLENVRSNDVKNSLHYENGNHSNISSFDSSVFVLSDEELVRRILNNLLTNACKYTKKGDVTLTVGLIHSLTDETRLRFEVKDNGIGIPDSKLEVIFEPFVQVDSTFSRPYDGIGLGLAICKRLVATLGGDIGVESKEGEGSTFWFEIPVIVERKGSPQDGAGEHSPIRRFDQPWKVLVAEDQHENQLFIKSCIEALNGVPVLVQTGVEAVAAVRLNHFDLILMDLSMPDMNGFDAIKSLKNDPDYQNIPIIALTAHTSKESRKQAFDAGADDFIPKPATLSDLSEVIEKNLKKPSSTELNESIS